MAVINKTVSGFIYEEDFGQVNLLWDVHPNANRIQFSNYSVGLLHGDERVMMTIPTPSDDFVFQATIEHPTTTLSDVGGIVVLSTTDDQIECQSYYDAFSTLPQNYSYIKVVKETKKEVNNGIINEIQIFNFYASQNGTTWYLVGSSELPNANRIGFFLDGPNTLWSNNFVIKNVAIYKSNIVTFNSLPSAFAISIKDSKKVEYATNLQTSKDESNFYIDLTNAVLPLRNVTLCVYDKDGNTLVEADNLELYGGDMFDCETKVSFFINNNQVDPLSIVDIGRLTSSDNEYTITIVNDETTTMTGKKLKVVMYSNYYRGGKFASIAIKNTDTKSMVFGEEITLPDILPHDGVDIVIKVIKDTDNAGPYFSNQYRFKILFQ
ncbi:hypothetical protein [Clostridium felsineum]|uniref:Uncharacterized protein n=1 Tax=Clostridium felsineum TaxID=36839 RepID=A0A1S8MEZ7_9CLOT|nr:hypothetical protein [Clostridium felsineum]URZ09244.1 hypothetical protein CLROS_046600 [Clostridium felsineum]URZ13930.1 hypothetical protein CROST_047080 [Clostridium felsineum]